MRANLFLSAFFAGAIALMLIPQAAAEPRDNTFFHRSEMPVYGGESRFGRHARRSSTKQSVSYSGNHKPGTIVIDTKDRKLYLVQQNNRAISYGVGVGRPGFEWGGIQRVTRKEEWPGWTPPPQMRKRQPYLPAYMPGGPQNPLGARALYLGSTLYRIHGTAEAHTIGEAVSSGCIRMLNDDVIDLYNRVGVGTKVVVLH